MRELHNNYIFLPKTQEENKKVKKDKSDINHETKTVYDYLEDLFGASLEGNYDSKGIYEYSANIMVKKASSRVLFILREVSSYIYMDVCICEKGMTRAISVMEYVNEQFNNSKIEFDYIMITSYDSVSEYFCNRAYPLLDNLVRNLYRLLYDIYTVNYGEQYVDNAEIPEYIKKNTNKNIYRSTSKKVKESNEARDPKKVEESKEFFYAIGFSEVDSLLFKKRWTKEDENRKSEFLKQNEDLSSLSDKELRDAFSEFSERSDWERFFGDNIKDIDVKELIESITDYRNIIAHCKIYTRTQYQDFKKIATELNSSILQAIEIAETVSFQENSSVSFRDAMENFGNMIAQFQTVIQPNIQSLVEAASQAINSISSTALSNVIQTTPSGLSQLIDGFSNYYNSKDEGGKGEIYEESDQDNKKEKRNDKDNINKAEDNKDNIDREDENKGMSNSDYKHLGDNIENQKNNEKPDGNNDQ